MKPPSFTPWSMGTIIQGTPAKRREQHPRRSTGSLGRRFAGPRPDQVRIETLVSTRNALAYAILR